MPQTVTVRTTIQLVQTTSGRSPSPKATISAPTGRCSEHIRRQTFPTATSMLPKISAETPNRRSRNRGATGFRSRRTGNWDTASLVGVVRCQVVSLIKKADSHLWARHCDNIHLHTFYFTLQNIVMVSCVLVVLTDQTLQIVLKGVLESTASASATASTPTSSATRWRADVDLVVNLIGLVSTVKVTDLMSRV